MYSSTHSWPRHWVGGEWSASRPGCFTPGKSPWYPLDRRLGGSQGRSGRGGEEKNSQPLPGIEPPIIFRSYTSSIYVLEEYEVKFHTHTNLFLNLLFQLQTKSSFIHSFVHSFIHSFIRSFVHSFIKVNRLRRCETDFTGSRSCSMVSEMLNLRVARLWVSHLHICLFYHLVTERAVWIASGYCPMAGSNFWLAVPDNLSLSSKIVR
jgi:hypothetical protein